LLRALPAKFCFLVDDGAAPGLAASHADVRIEAIHGESPGRVAVVVDGARDRAVVVRTEEGAATAMALAKAFIELRDSREFELRRMRSLVHAFGIDALYQAAGLAGSPYDSDCRGVAMREVFGVHAAGTLWFAGVGAPFGRWRAEDLAWLGARASAEGVDELRLTPWRALLAPTRSRAAAEAIVLSCAERGLIVDGDEPSLFVASCPGAPECPQARGETRGAAQRLAAAARALYRDDARPGLHLSGCSKGCAMPYAARATVVTNGEAFDVILNGGASDAPAFRLASLDEIEDLLKTLAYKPGEKQARSREAEWPAQ
jgi:precorrin-3B synthase